MQQLKRKKEVHIKISGEPVEVITDFLNSLSGIFKKTKNPPLPVKTIFNGKQYTEKFELTEAIILFFSKKYPELARKFYLLAETKTMNREIANEINAISPLWYQTVMEYFDYAKSR